MRRVYLREVCHARAGDKGDTANIAVIAYTSAQYFDLCNVLTAERVQDYFAHLGVQNVTRYELPGVLGLNFVLTRALDGGSTRSLRIDGFGKSLSAFLLSMQIDLPSGECSSRSGDPLEVGDVIGTGSRGLR
jgi:hypothetical protein